MQEAHPQGLPLRLVLFCPSWKILTWPWIRCLVWGLGKVPRIRVQHKIRPSLSTSISKKSYIKEFSSATGSPQTQAVSVLLLTETASHQHQLLFQVEERHGYHKLAALLQTEA